MLATPRRRRAPRLVARFATTLPTSPPRVRLRGRRPRLPPRRRVLLGPRVRRIAALARSCCSPSSRRRAAPAAGPAGRRSARSRAQMRARRARRRARCVVDLDTGARSTRRAPDVAADARLGREALHHRDRAAAARRRRTARHDGARRRAAGRRRRRSTATSTCAATATRRSARSTCSDARAAGRRRPACIARHRPRASATRRRSTTAAAPPSSGYRDLDRGRPAQRADA